MHATHRLPTMATLCLGALLGLAMPAAGSPGMVTDKSTPARHNATLTVAWQAWMAQHRPQGYATDADAAHAYQAFVENDAIITAHNARGDASYTLGHTLWSDLTRDEFFHKMKRQSASARVPRGLSVLTSVKETGQEDDDAVTARLPDSVDWTAEGKVTPVMNEGQCGATWAMSAVGAIESLLAIHDSDKAIPLSVAQVMDCDNKTDNGCNGGEMTTAMHYVATGHPLCKASDYPYVPRNGPCKPCEPYAGITGYSTTTDGDENALQAAVVKQPISVAVDAADSSAWQLYKGGIIDTPTCGKQLDHALLLVGYGTDSAPGDDKPYWKVRNQWGAEWGEEGYARLVRGSNMCGIANECSYPLGAHRV